MDEGMDEAKAEAPPMTAMERVLIARQLAVASMRGFGLDLFTWFLVLGLVDPAVSRLVITDDNYEHVSDEHLDLYSAAGLVKLIERLVARYGHGWEVRLSLERPEVVNDPEATLAALRERFCEGMPSMLELAQLTGVLVGEDEQVAPSHQKATVRPNDKWWDGYLADLDGLWPEPVRTSFGRRLRLRTPSLACAGFGLRRQYIRRLADLERRLDTAYELGRASVVNQLSPELRAAMEAEQRPVGLAGAKLGLWEVTLPESARVSTARIWTERQS